MSTLNGDKKSALVYGFVREQEEELMLYMHITAAIVELIIQLFPILSLKFGKFEFDVDLFTLSNNNTVLKIKKNDKYSTAVGHKEDDCILYANHDSYGIDKGVHLWSIKAIGKHWKAKYWYCTRTMGITTRRRFTEVPRHIITGQYFYQGSTVEGTRWKIGDILTMKLDCDNWIVEFYLNEKLMKQQIIGKVTKYFMALCCCSSHNQIYYESVDTPSSILFS